MSQGRRYSWIGENFAMWWRTERKNLWAFVDVLGFSRYMMLRIKLNRNFYSLRESHVSIPLFTCTFVNQGNLNFFSHKLGCSNKL